MQRAKPTADPPVLDLSGPRLTASLQTLVNGAEPDGGVERYVAVLQRKVALFQGTLADGKAARLDADAFKRLCVFISPVRRRIAARLEADGFASLRGAIVDLLEGATDTTTADARMRAFCARFPQDRQHRWVRDLAAELLHYLHPELYPLMCRWVWDVKANTGVLREIWHAENVDHIVIDVDDGYGTFLELRRELSQFLTDNGVFRDVLLYVDLLCAQVYAGYISAQGGSYLRTDFAGEEDSLPYVRRLLGLDGVTRSGRTRLKTLDGTAHVLEDVRLFGPEQGTA